MTIQPLSNKPGNAHVASKPAQNDKTQATNTHSIEKARDSVDITAVAKEITKAFESSKTTHVINQERVDAVKKALEEGTYPINAERIANKMIEFELKQLDNKPIP